MALGLYPKYDRGIKPGMHNSARPHWSGSRRHTTQAVKLSYRKLKEGGKLMAVVDPLAVEYIVEALKKSQFKEEKISVRPLSQIEYDRTYWTRRATTFDGVKKLYQIIAIK